jgi:hypothetical protein
MNTVSGSCLCGAVKFTASDPRQVVACHCSQCRKQSGHFWAASNAAQVDITGADNLTWYAASTTAKRGFCKTCGAALFWQAHDDDNTAFSAGSLDAPHDLSLIKHIFVDDKGSYYELDPVAPEADRADVWTIGKD